MLNYFSNRFKNKFGTSPRPKLVDYSWQPPETEAVRKRTANARAGSSSAPQHSSAHVTHQK